MMNNKKGQIFVSLMIFIMAIIIFILAAPILSTIINESIGEMGSATAFAVKLFLWLILLVFIASFIISKTPTDGLSDWLGLHFVDILIPNYHHNPMPALFRPPIAKDQVWSRH